MTTRTVVGLVVFLGAGFGLRSLPKDASPGALAWRPWATTTVTLYFPDGPVLVPVSRRIARTGDAPRAALQALLAGPGARSGLQNPVPPGVQIRSFEVRDGTAHIDLSSAAAAEAAPAHTAETAIIETMTALAGVAAVSLSVDGQVRAESAKRVPLLYYASMNGLVAVPVSAANPRRALATYLGGPPDPGLIGLPSDVRLLAYEHDRADRVLSLNFSYTPSVRTLALEQAARMRLVLLGLIASLTEFSSVRAVRLDFEGRTRLGLGECSDLLRTVQPRPELLNDERLLGR